MNDSRKQRLVGGLDMLNGQLYALKDLLSAAQRELDHLPPFIEYADLHNHLSDFTDDLDSVVTDLYFLIKTMEISLSTTIDQSPTKEVFLRPWQPASEPAGQQEQTKPLNFFQKLILGIGAERAFLAEERYYQERKQERERRWDDTLNWQDAARRDDPFGDGVDDFDV